MDYPGAMPRGGNGRGRPDFEHYLDGMSYDRVQEDDYGPGDLGPDYGGPQGGNHGRGGPAPRGGYPGPGPGGPMRGGPMPRGGPMRGGPMRGGPMPHGGPMRGGPMPRGGPRGGGPMPGPGRGFPPPGRGGRPAPPMAASSDPACKLAYLVSTSTPEMETDSVQPTDPTISAEAVTRPSLATNESTILTRNLVYWTTWPPWRSVDRPADDRRNEGLLWTTMAADDPPWKARGVRPGAWGDIPIRDMDPLRRTRDTAVVMVTMTMVTEHPCRLAATSSEHREEA